MIDWSELRAMRVEAIWNGLRMLVDAFLVAAGAHPWMWLVLVVVVVTASRRAWLKLGRFVGGSFLRHEAGQ